MDPDLKAFLEAMERTINANIDASEERTNDRMRLLHEDVITRIEAMETRLLTEFFKWASPRDVRQRANTTDIRALEAEVQDLQERVAKLEGPKGSSFR